MEKIVIHRPGGYEQLRLEEHPDPIPGKGEILVSTEGVGVNYADCCVRLGVYSSAKKYVGWPITPGFEFSGKVAAVGDEVRNFKIGDPVFGVTRFGAYASKVIAPEHQVFRLPSQMNVFEASGFPAVFLTAYHALFSLIYLKKNSTLLIHSAAGGVGTALLQLARVAGHRTIGVVGASHKVEVAKKFGADEVIDKSKEDLWTKAKEYAPHGYDAIFDANGYETLKPGYQQLASSGKMVIYGFATMLPKQGSGTLNYLKLLWGLWKTPKYHPFDLVTDNKSVIGFNLSYLFSEIDFLADSMKQLTQWLEEGKIQPPQVTRFSLADAAKAHQTIESGQSTGKLILEPQLKHSRLKT